MNSIYLEIGAIVICLLSLWDMLVHNQLKLWVVCSSTHIKNYTRHEHQTTCRTACQLVLKCHSVWVGVFLVQCNVIDFWKFKKTIAANDPEKHNVGADQYMFPVFVSQILEKFAASGLICIYCCCFLFIKNCRTWVKNLFDFYSALGKEVLKNKRVSLLQIQFCTQECNFKSCQWE